jgi:PPM family protein phosphatase
VKRGRRRRTSVLVAIGAIFLLVLVPAWVASRAVFFLCVDDRGLVTVYQGVPYDVTAGIALYSELRVSGVPARALGPADRRAVTEHKWRSRADALAVLARLERASRRPLGSR